MATQTKTARTAKNAGAEADKAVQATFDAAEKAIKGDRAARGGDVTDGAFAYPRFEMPEAFRSLAEQGLNQTREAYARLKAATEESTDLLEESFQTTRDGVRDVQLKALEAAKTGSDATFDFLRQVIGVGSVAEVVQLQTAFVRERFEAFVDYSKDVQATMRKVSAEAGKPAQALFERSLTQAKAA